MKPKYPAKQLLKLYEEHGQGAVDKFIDDAVAEKKLSLSDYSIRDLAETFLGESWSKGLRQLALSEAGQPVMSTNFSNIVGQLMFSEIRKGFELESFVFSQRVPTFQSKIAGTETVPEISPMGDVSQVVVEGQEYPSVGVTEAYYTLPAKAKQGMKIEVTEESIFFDLTGQLQQAASEVGKYLGLKKEKDICDVIIGQTNNYIRNGTATNTYLTAGAYVNNQSSAALLDWTDIESAELLLRDMLHPDTSEPLAPIMPGEMQLIVMPFKKHTARQILGATQFQVNTASAVYRNLAPNSLDAYDLIDSSELIYRRLLATIEPTAAVARDVWFLGSLQKAFGWYENWPLQVFRQGGDSQAAFDRDVSLVYKARYRGVAAVREPRYMTRNEGTAI